MRAVVVAVVQSIASIFRSRTALQIEVLALRHQLAVYQRAGRRPRLVPADRLLWAWLSRAWAGWRQALFLFDWLSADSLLYLQVRLNSCSTTEVRDRE